MGLHIFGPDASEACQVILWIMDRRTRKFHILSETFLAFLLLEDPERSHLVGASGERDGASEPLIPHSEICKCYFADAGIVKR